MGKAIQGAAEIAGAIGMGALAFFQPELIAVPGYIQAMGALGLAGLAMEGAALADALTANRGQNITTRQAASFRQIVYGTQRVGGVEVFRSTTGSKHDQFNFVIMLATHQLSAIQDLYLDGRRVYWQGGSGSQTRGGYTFGGSSDGNTYTGPDGQPYNFGDRGHGPMVYCEARYGDQVQGDYILALANNDNSWGPGGSQAPSAVGCAYVYLKLEYDESVFPQLPEIRFTLQGKPVYDPRTGTTAYSHNPALIINDILTDTRFGIGDSSANQAQLIAAANICEEQVSCAAGHEDRYAAHWHYDTSVEPGDAIATILDTMGGRMARIGGEWQIFPAAYIAPTLNIGPDHLRSAVRWSEKRAGKDKFNRVTGTYIAPNYPYNAAGNLYDSNGWYNGGRQNNFPFAFQPTNYPMYAKDSLHGYPSDEYLNEDGAVQLNKEIGFPAVLSISQAQRLAKIALMRNRQQGSGSFDLSMAGFQLQPCDTFNFTFGANGWTEKLLEVNGLQFSVDTSGSAPRIKLAVSVNETDPSVYDWSPTEELTVYDVPVTYQTPSVPAPPTNMALISSAATALKQQDGSVLPRIQVTWDTPQDIFASQIQIQYRQSGSGTWLSAPSVDISLNLGYISGIISGLHYDVRIRSQRTRGTTSAWVEIDNFVAGLVLSVGTRIGVGIGSLLAEAYTNGTAAIICQPFSAAVGSSTLIIFPSGQVTIPNLSQQTNYYVYYDDPTYVGGDVTPVATTNLSDITGVLGRFLIDSIITPYCSATGATSRYAPSTYSDNGTRTTGTPDSAYDGDVSTSASVGSNASATYLAGVGSSPPETDTTEADGDIIFTGFPAIITSTALNLYVTASATFSGTGGATCGTAEISATIAGTSSVLVDFSSASAGGTFSIAVPAGTNLSTISVRVVVSAGGTGAVSSRHTSSISRMTIPVTEIYVTT